MSLDITPLVPEGRQIIQSYGDGGFRISDVDHMGAVLVFPEQTIAWACTELADINPETLLPIFERPTLPEILLIGCGETFTRPPEAVQGVLRARGVQLEWMATGAACRTYNVLAIEDRIVACAILAVG